MKQSLGSRIVILFFIAILVVTYSRSIGSSLSSLSAAGGSNGYISAFQGPKASFYGVSWDPDGNGATRYYSTDSFASGASMRNFGATLQFDGDGVQDGFPNIIGEQTTVYIPSSTLINPPIPSWLPASWFNTQGYIQNPQKVYTWQDSNGYAYNMTQWLLRYYVTFSGEWDGGVKTTIGLLPPFIYTTGWGEAPPQPQYTGGQNFYKNLQVWIKLDLTPTWYIQGIGETGTGYFAIAKVQLADDVKYGSNLNQIGSNGAGRSDPSGNVLNSMQGSVSPESAASVVEIYYQPWGAGGVADTAPETFQGHDLNPNYFTNQVYMKVDLNQFGVYGGFSSAPLPFGAWVRGDSVSFAFDVTVFVIGKWTVQDIQNNPTDYGRFTRVDQVNDLLSWLISPSTLSWLLPLAVFILALIFVPQILFMLKALFS